MKEKMIAKDNNQLTLIFNSNTRTGKHALAYVQASKDDLLAIDISKTKVPDTQWIEISQHLNKSVEKLIDTTQVEEDTSNFTEEDWVTILQNNRDVLQKPIAINGTRVQQIQNVTDITSFFGVDSAGLEKTMHHQPPTTSSTTDDENFK